MGVPWVLRATWVRPSRSTASVALLAADDGVAGDDEVGLGGAHLGGVEVIRVVGDLDVAPGGAALCARPAASCVTTPLPSRCAAIPSSWPMVMTPVPPTPATTMPQACGAAGTCGSGRGGSELLTGRAAARLAWRPQLPPSTVTKLGQKPFRQE